MRHRLFVQEPLLASGVCEEPLLQEVDQLHAWIALVDPRPASAAAAAVETTPLASALATAATKVPRTTTAEMQPGAAAAAAKPLPLRTKACLEQDLSLAHSTCVLSKLTCQLSCLALAKKIIL